LDCTARSAIEYLLYPFGKADTVGFCAQHQITKEYYKPYFAKTEPMFIKPREFKLVDRLKPGDWTRSKPENLRP